MCGRSSRRSSKVRQFRSFAGKQAEAIRVSRVPKGVITDLPLNAESMLYLRKECFLDTLAALLERKEHSEVQDARVRALYWFADAHADRNTTMRFIKLWSCVECFFAIEDKDVTGANARGLATILTFAGFGLGKVEDYSKLKKRIKSLYDLRSRAVHRAEFDEVQPQDLEDFFPLDCLVDHLDDLAHGAWLSNSPSDQRSNSPPRCLIYERASAGANCRQ
jgi:hypothetical protein